MNTIFQRIKTVDNLEPRSNLFQSWFPFMRWTPTSPQKLQEAEENIIEYVETQSEGFYVNIGEVNGQECNIWTRKFSHRNDSKGFPLVMVHGMGAGLAMFAMNFDTLAQARDVYAVDLPGFGRSSRVNFSSEPGQVEEQYVECVEKWREKTGLSKMNLLGHSFGGYLTALYTIKYPHHVQHAILADPWGMTEKPTQLKTKPNIPSWALSLGKVFQHFNPLFSLRVSGPAGPWLIRKWRPGLVRKYENLLGTGKSYLISDYLFHCNGHRPTGESAFHRLMTGFGWANNPLLPRLEALDRKSSLKVLYGSNTWMTHLQQSDFTESGVKCPVDVEYIEKAGHHIYADNSNSFNDAVNKHLEERN